MNRVVISKPKINLYFNIQNVHTCKTNPKKVIKKYNQMLLHTVTLNVNVFQVYGFLEK